MTPSQPSEIAMTAAISSRVADEDVLVTVGHAVAIDVAYAPLVKACKDVENWLTMLNDAGDVGGYEQDVLDKFVAAIARATPKEVQADGTSND